MLFKLNNYNNDESFYFYDFVKKIKRSKSTFLFKQLIHEILFSGELVNLIKIIPSNF